MQRADEKPYDVGVIVGRFQVDMLHAGHRELIQHVVDKHPRVIVLLGVAATRGERDEALDFEARKMMILEEFPSVICLYVKDMNNNAAWSHALDMLIRDVVSPRSSVVLYGSRQSFIAWYSGNYDTQELLQSTYISGTDVRNDIARRVNNSRDFRAGWIHGAYDRYPAVVPTVDIAIFKDASASALLLVRKPGEPLWRFPGGYADPGSPTYEVDATREAREETQLEVSRPEYIGSTVVDDWRYRSSVNKIKTILFAAYKLSGAERPSDDLKGGDMRWVDITVGDKVATLSTDILGRLHEQMMPEHKPPANMLAKWAMMRFSARVSTDGMS